MNESLSLSIYKNIQLCARNLPQCSPYQGCLSHGKTFPYCHSPKEHMVILVGSILQVFQGSLSVWSVNRLPARYRLKRLIPHTTARHSSMIDYLASARLNFLLA